MNELLGPLKTQKPSTKWVDVEIRFIGGDNYCLASKQAEASLRCVKGGFKIALKKDLDMPVTTLMGPKIRTCTLVDVELHFRDLVLSMKEMVPGSYPKRLVEGDYVRLS
jgi:hypothetical protein